MYVLPISGSGPPSMAEMVIHPPKNRQVAPIPPSTTAPAIATNARTHFKYPDHKITTR
jgi:hypothetical protein